MFDGYSFVGGWELGDDGVSLETIVGSSRCGRGCFEMCDVWRILLTGPMMEFWIPISNNCRS